MNKQTSHLRVQSRRSLLALAASTVLIAACGKNESASTVAPSQAYAMLQVAGVGFEIGTPGGETAYVMFDPMCGHCAALWDASQPLISEQLFIWVPVAILGSKSRDIATQILSAPDPVMAMRTHKENMSKDKSLGNMPVSAEWYQAVDDNTALFRNFDSSGVPLLVSERNNGILTHSGSMETDKLRTLLAGKMFEA